MNSSKKQKGATLLISMIMLVVLTLLVVFSIRSSNTNLRIAGNMQTQAEANAATQQVIEKVIEQINVTEDISLIAAQDVAVVVGPATYTVHVEPLTECKVQTPVLNSSLDPGVENDLACFESTDSDISIKADDTATTKPSACKLQQWEIEASVTDTASGAKVSHVQGVSIRVPSTVACS